MVSQDQFRRITGRSTTSFVSSSLFPTNVSDVCRYPDYRSILAGRPPISTSANVCVLVFAVTMSGPSCLPENVSKHYSYTEGEIYDASTAPGVKWQQQARYEH